MVLDRFFECWEGLDDPRTGNASLHDFHEILAIAMCAVLCGGQGSVDMGLFAKSKEPFLRGFLNLENGVPSHVRAACRRRHNRVDLLTSIAGRGGAFADLLPSVDIIQLKSRMAATCGLASAFGQLEVKASDDYGPMVLHQGSNRRASAGASRLLRRTKKGQFGSPMDGRS
jgi:hypothetical protein